MFEEQNLAGKVNKIAKMLALEGLQPKVTEAFLKEEEDNQCRLEKMKDSNDSWNILIIVVIMINIIGFAAVIFALWKLYRRVAKHYDELYYRVEKR